MTSAGRHITDSEEINTMEPDPLRHAAGRSTVVDDPVSFSVWWEPSCSVGRVFAAPRHGLAQVAQLVADFTPKRGRNR